MLNSFKLQKLKFKFEYIEGTRYSSKLDNTKIETDKYFTSQMLNKYKVIHIILYPSHFVLSE